MKAGKIIFWTLLAGAVVTGSILAYRKFSVKDPQKLADDLKEAAKNNPALAGEAAAAAVTAAASQTAPSGFPLRRGSNNAYVKTMQSALMDTYGRETTLPKYGADGIFGAETEKALTSKGFPTVVTQNDYNNIIAGRSVNGTAIRGGSSIGIGPFAGAYQVGPEGVNIKFY